VVQRMIAILMQQRIFSVFDILPAFKAGRMSKTS
jgi:hypothetical protein